jgi:hypothetical protein
MLRLLTLTALFAGSLDAHPHVEPPVEESAATRQTLGQAGKITLSEGLPHPGKETAAFRTESARRDTYRLADFTFYKPAIKPGPNVTSKLKDLLASPSGLSEWKEKRCGGFNPDWAVSWSTGFRKKDHALICFGCRQVIYLTPDAQLRYDLNPKSFNRLKDILATLRRKRPSVEN